MVNDSPRKIELDIEALGLCALCIFLWLSLLSYDPADSLAPVPGWISRFVVIDQAVYPANTEIQNACGWFGALAAALLVQAMGAGAILVALGLSVLTAWMFRVQENYVRASRQVGWALVVVAFTTFLALLGINTPLTPTIGPGGYLGALTSIWLGKHFALLGSMILTLAVFIAGLLLSTDYVVVSWLSWLLASGATAANTAASAARSTLRPRPGAKSTANNPARSDVEGGVQLAGAELSGLGHPSMDMPPIRIGGKDRPTTDAALPESAGQSRNSFLGSAKSLAAGILGTQSDLPTENHDQASELDDDQPRPVESAPEEDEEELPPTSESRELDVDGEKLLVRADLPHENTPEPVAPTVKTPKSKAKARSKAEEREALSESLAHLDDTKLPAGAEEYVLPGIDLLLKGEQVDFEAQTIEVRRKAKVLESTFKDFGLNVRVVEIETGPVIAQYEIELEAGLRLSKVTSLADDLAIALRVPGVRIVAPIPGKNTVGIEVPNENRQVVRLREVIEEQGARGKKARIPLFLGKDVSGNALTADLATLPHLLIAGRTGTGKSVCLNAIIASILMTRRPDEVRMLMIDPKMVELSGFGRLPHLMHPVVTDMKKAEAILAWAVDKMEERYSLLARAGVRHITSYNELGREELLDRLQPDSVAEAEHVPDHLPFIVIVADEMADLMMTAGKEVEQHIIRLAQKSRAVGIHLILATQKPTVDVITGLIKSNLPARIAFQVASQTDSRVVLDEVGANKLLGNGDMLFLWPGTSMLLRGQGTFLTDEELNSIVDHCSTGEQNFVNELVNLKVKDESGDEAPLGALRKRDELYESAVDVVVREGRGSCSLLQRALGIGYGRAARLIDYMAEDGIVGQYAGSQAREVQISIADWEAMRGGTASEEEPPQRSNRIQPASTTPSNPRSDSPQAAEPPKPIRFDSTSGGSAESFAPPAVSSPPSPRPAVSRPKDLDQDNSRPPEAASNPIEDESDQAEDQDAFDEENVAEVDEELDYSAGDSEACNQDADEQGCDDDDQGESADEGADADRDPDAQRDDEVAKKLIALSDDAEYEDYDD